MSEAAIALKLGKPVIALNVSWDLAGVKPAASPAEAGGHGLGGDENQKIIFGGRGYAFAPGIILQKVEGFFSLPLDGGGPGRG